MSDYGYSDALAMVEAELGQVFTWNGADYHCTIGERTEQLDLGAGGFAAGADLVLVVRRGHFTDTIPGAQELVTVSGRQLRISSVDHAPCSTFLVLKLVDDKRGV